MRRLRRAYQRGTPQGGNPHHGRRKKFKRRVITAGSAAVITFGRVINCNYTLAGYTADNHQLSVPMACAISQDADGDLLSNKEEIAIGYHPFKADQNRNEIPDGVELAKRCAAVIEQLPWEDKVTDPTQTYKWLTPTFGLESCDICGATVNMGPAGIVNPRLGLRVDCPLIAIHYLEHGSFGYKGDEHQGRLDVAALLRALELRFPYEPDEHQSTGWLTPLPVDGYDFDGDLLTDNEELAAGYNLYSIDQDNDLIADGIELARQCAEVIDALAVYEPYRSDVTEVYKISFLQRGLEWCEICGESVNMGYWQVINPKLGFSIEVPDIVCHYMGHGSFSYSGDVHGKGRIDVALLVKTLEMPRRCGDLGTIYPAGDINQDCRVDIDDLVVFFEQWLEQIEPNQD